MPILKSETSEFPAGLLSVSAGECLTRRWWAVHTRPRQEKALARELVRLSLPFYLPLVSKSNWVRGKEVRAHLPLFDGYVFLYVDEEERVRALTTERVVRLVAVGDQQRMRHDLVRLRGLIASNAPPAAASAFAPVSCAASKEPS
jgi:transcriptional antiterminator RfaH